jgi:hypothetical protein
LGGVVSILLLIALAWLRLSGVEAGNSALVAQGFSSSVVRKAAIGKFLLELLPLYLVVGYLVYIAARLWAALPFTLGRRWERPWSALRIAGITTCGIGVVHTWLWWEVPTALWLVPGIGSLPLLLVFPMLALLFSAGLLAALSSRGQTWQARLITLAGWHAEGWLLASILLAVHVPALAPPPVRPSDRPTRVLLLGIDALRADIAAQAGMASLDGVHFENAYSVVPVTRLVWSLLWGGDPKSHVNGHTLVEKGADDRFRLVERAKASGIKARFFSDAEGYGMVRMTCAFDKVVMPEAGWRNYAGTYLSQYFPLYAVWVSRTGDFPTANPWSPLDLPLKWALEQGRGSEWVMLHSSVTQHPIFLQRRELDEIPGWWQLSASDYEPLPEWPSEGTRARDERADPFLAYRIRAQHVLGAWRPIWNRLAEDPDYRGAVRFLFSDHGEEFHPLGTGHLEGMHGFDLNPAELRVPLVLAGPDVEPGVRRVTAATSLLAVRNAVAGALLRGAPVRADTLQVLDFAPMAYQTIDTRPYRDPALKLPDYRELPIRQIVESAEFFPDGYMVMTYDASSSQRWEDVSIGLGHGARLTVYKPLEGGGAHRLVFDGYALVAEEFVSEETYSTEKERVEAQLLTPLP